MLENDDNSWTYVFDKEEMRMLGTAVSDSLVTPSTFEVVCEDLSERMGISQAKAGSIMIAGFSHYLHSDDVEHEVDESFLSFLEDFAQTILEESGNA